jgi:hypothetical protein
MPGCSFLAPFSRVALPNRKFPFSFSRASFINPRIIQDLSGSLSDSGDEIVAINLLKAQESNRYAGDVRTRNVKGQRPFVYTEIITVENGETNHTEFGYQFVGTTTSGVNVLLTSDWGGGSGVFTSLLLVTFETDKSIACDWNKGVIRSAGTRLLIKKMGEIALGDRWDGQLKVIKNSIFIGRDAGWFTSSGGKGGGWMSADPKGRMLKITIDR